MSTFRKTLWPILVSRTLLYALLTMFIVLTTVLMVSVFIRISAILLVLVAFYLYLVYTGLSSKFRLLFLLFRLYLSEKRDKQAALELLDSEIFDLNELLHAEKSEMDVHRLNTRDEADAMRYSKRGERDIRANLGLLKRLQEILVTSMRKEPGSIYDVDLDRY